MTRPAEEARDGALRVASLSDVGRVRTVNEDSCDSLLRSDGARLLLVADGMGGHRGGATASREAVARIGREFVAGGAGDATEAVAALRRAIERANDHVFEMAHGDPGLAGMGTTVVALLVDAGGRGTVAHVGDSRAYRWRGRRLEQLTTDHSVVAEMQRRGVLSAEEAAYHPRRNEILRSVGVLPEVDVEIAPVELAPGDWYLLCSDGLCGVVSDAEIEEVLAAAPTAAAAARGLVDLANDCGGPDNVTVALLEVPIGWRPAPAAVGPDAFPGGTSSARVDGGEPGVGRDAAKPETPGLRRGVRARDVTRGTSTTTAWLVIGLFTLAAYWLWRLVR